MAKWFEEIFMDSPCWKRASPSSDPTSSEEGKSLSFSSRSSVFPAILISECINEPTSRRKQQTNHQLSCKWSNGGKYQSQPSKIWTCSKLRMQHLTLKSKHLGEPNFILLLSPWWQAYVPLSCTHILNMQGIYHIPPFLWRYGWVTENKSSITNLN